MSASRASALLAAPALNGPLLDRRPQRRRRRRRAVGGGNDLREEEDGARPVTGSDFGDFNLKRTRLDEPGRRSQQVSGQHVRWRDTWINNDFGKKNLVRTALKRKGENRNSH